MRLEFDALRHDRFLRYLNLFCKSVLKGAARCGPFCCWRNYGRDVPNFSM